MKHSTVCKLWLRRSIQRWEMLITSKVSCLNVKKNVSSTRPVSNGIAALGKSLWLSMNEHDMLSLSMYTAYYTLPNINYNSVMKLFLLMFVTQTRA